MNSVKTIWKFLREKENIMKDQETKSRELIMEDLQRD